MKAAEEAHKRLRELIRFSEGVCGIYHQALAVASELGFHVKSVEVPEGTVCELVSSSGEVIGRGLDITWSPAALAALLDASFIPDPWSRRLKESLTSREDMEKVKEIFGYGRIVRPAAAATAKVLMEGGRVEVERSGLGVRVAYYDSEGGLISEAVGVFCPACAAVIAAARSSELRSYVRERLSGEINTGKVKAERGLVSEFRWKKGRVEASIKDSGGRVLGSNIGCCTAYAVVRAEIAAGLASSRVARILKAYCDQCALKHLWLGKSIGAVGNVVLKRLSELGYKALLSYNSYVEVEVYEDGKLLGFGRGTLCALSAVTDMIFRAGPVKIVKPSPSRDFPEPPSEGRNSE